MDTHIKIPGKSPEKAKQHIFLNVGKYAGESPEKSKMGQPAIKQEPEHGPEFLDEPLTSEHKPTSKHGSMPETGLWPDLD